MILFKPNYTKLIAVLERIPGATLKETDNYITLSRGGYTVYIARLPPNRSVPSHQRLWYEEGNATPRHPGDLRFRYEVDRALYAADHEAR